MKWLQQHALFGGPQYRIIPLHSQLPREDQRQVFRYIKFHIFSIMHKLREINSEDSRSAKPAILTHLEASNFDFLRFFALFEG